MWQSDIVPGPEYVLGMDRSTQGKYMRSHYYLLKNGEYEPMCRFAWNRDDGESFSIWRGHMGNRGLCKICLKRAQQGLGGVRPWPHKIKDKC